MSRNLTSSLFLNLAFIALMTPQFAFSAGTHETSSQPGEESQKVVAAPAPKLSFEMLPSGILSLILAELSKKDQGNLRSVNKNLKDKITEIITNVRIPANLPNKKQVEKFFEDLASVKFGEGKKPSEAFVNLFRRAPIEELYLPYGKISAKDIVVIAPFFPVGLKNLYLVNCEIDDEGIKMLAPHLPANLQELKLMSNKIGDLGAQALAPHLPATLQRLYLGNNKIEAEGVKMLAPHLPATLQRLV